jgi:hypothetical protein
MATRTECKKKLFADAHQLNVLVEIIKREILLKKPSQSAELFAIQNTPVKKVAKNRLSKRLSRVLKAFRKDLYYKRPTYKKPQYAPASISHSSASA